MIYEVTGGSREVYWGSDPVQQILQNIAMIITTPKGSVPLRRDWFIDATLLDTPMLAAQARLAAEIFRAIRTHEPRAQIVGPIRFIQDPADTMSGRLIPSVSVRIVV